MFFVDVIGSRAGPTFNFLSTITIKTHLGRLIIRFVCFCFRRLSQKKDGTSAAPCPPVIRLHSRSRFRFSAEIRISQQSLGFHEECKIRGESRGYREEVPARMAVLVDKAQDSKAKRRPGRLVQSSSGTRSQVSRQHPPCKLPAQAPVSLHTSRNQKRAAPGRDAAQVLTRCTHRQEARSAVHTAYISIYYCVHSGDRAQRVSLFRFFFYEV